MLSVSHIVNSVFTSRTYILAEEAKPAFWLVDCGDMPPLIAQLSLLAGDSFSIKGVLLTHAHYDHIYGLPRLTELFPEVKVYTNERGRDALTDPRLNMSKYHGDPVVYKSDNVVVCGEGSVIGLFDGVRATVYDMPGHHPSCLVFEVGANLFTGDAYIPGEKVVTTLPGGDKELAAASLERIMKLSVGRVVFPGHDMRNSLI